GLSGLIAAPIFYAYLKLNILNFRTSIHSIYAHIPTIISRLPSFLLCKKCIIALINALEVKHFEF
ncbi:hypothetical protein VZ169_12745, partial [Acinetobacter baumannii]|uniref:hypothetical protein n=1 Tax=Acinetobacter baumannii TaxID=470 RepID=UPI002E2A0D41